jgi:hypothetical protein
MMSFAVHLVSDFVFTPYVLRQRHGIKVTPTTVTCCMELLKAMHGEQHSLFHCVNPLVISLSTGYMHLFTPTGPTMCLLSFSQNNNTLYFSPMN